MKPVAVTISRFRGWKNQQRVSLAAPITSVQAANGIGKSSLLNAIEWCLFGAKVTTKGSQRIGSGEVMNTTCRQISDILNSSHDSTVVCKSKAYVYSTRELPHEHVTKLRNIKLK